MFYSVTRATGISLAKHAKTVEILKKYRDGINAACDYVEIELLNHVGGHGGQITTVFKFQNRADWVKYIEDESKDLMKIWNEFVTAVKELGDSVDTYQSFYESMD